MVFEHTFPVAGDYHFEICLSRDRNGEIEGLIGGSHEVELLIDGEAMKAFTVVRPKNGNHNDVDTHLNVPAGNGKIGVTFPKKPTSLLETKRQPYDAQFNFHRHPRQAPAIFQVSVTGPFQRQDARPNLTKDDLPRLMHLAYRRPITDKDRSTIAPFLDEDIEMAVAAILVSPRFLFRVENDPADLASGEVYRLSNPQIATRLTPGRMPPPIRLF